MCWVEVGRTRAIFYENLKNGIASQAPGFQDGIKSH